MAGLKATVNPVVTRLQPYPADIGSAPASLRRARTPFSEDVASALENIQNNLDTVNSALRNNSPVVRSPILVEDPSGRIIAAFGEYEIDGVATEGAFFASLYAGFPLGSTNPANAVLTVTPDGRVMVGANGWLDVVDPFGKDAGWIGTQNDTLAVIGAVNNGAGLIRLTVTAHTLLTGDVAKVLNVGGVPNATGIWTVTKVDANHVDLQTSAFAGTYTSGGTIDRILHITGAANNGSGLIRITIAAHGYISGDQVSIANVGGVPNATGQWVITVIDSSHFDLIGSTWAGAYTSGGICLRYFAGALFQEIAIAGTTWQNAKLKAQANGDLDITNALITLVNGTKSIVLDPSVPRITVQDTSTTVTLTIDTVDGFKDVDVTNNRQAQITNGFVQVLSVTPTGGYVIVQPGLVNVGNVGLNNAQISSTVNGTGAFFTVLDDTGTHMFTVNGQSGSNFIDVEGSVKVGGTVVIDNGRNVNANSYASNGTPGISGSKTFLTSVSVNFVAQTVSTTSGTIGYTTGLVTS